MIPVVSLHRTVQVTPVNAQDIVNQILAERPRAPASATADAPEVYAPANIALVKYWGKRDTELNLPVTSSLSVSMGGHGTFARVTPADAFTVTIDGELIPSESKIATRMGAYLDLFKDFGGPFALVTRSTVPVGAGLASSASAFASVVAALDATLGWNLDQREHSILARLGSGSASRSVTTGFVEWVAGERADGMDSHARPLTETWPDFRLGLVKVHDGPKPVGSREAMLRTVETSPLYAAWPAKVAGDLRSVKAAIAARDLRALGPVAEANAVAMHYTMHGAVPPVDYWLPASREAMHRIIELRQTDGVPAWFTMDAGPNLKLLFEAGSEAVLREAFPDLEVVAPFSTTD